jgi:ATP-binding cassette subfamily B (MDR/TAP) protein 1
LAQFIASFVIAFTINWKLTLTVLCTIPLLVLNGGIFNKFIIKCKRQVSDYRSQSATIAEESISTIRTTVAFSQQENISKLYDSKLENAKSPGIKSIALNGIYIGMNDFIIDLAYALAFWYGSRQVVNDETTTGKVSLYYYFLFSCENTIKININ